ILTARIPWKCWRSRSKCLSPRERPKRSDSLAPLPAPAALGWVWRLQTIENRTHARRKQPFVGAQQVAVGHAGYVIANHPVALGCVAGIGRLRIPFAWLHR